MNNIEHPVKSSPYATERDMHERKYVKWGTYLFIYLFHLYQHTILLKSAIIKSKTALQL